LALYLSRVRSNEVLERTCRYFPKLTEATCHKAFWRMPCFCDTGSKGPSRSSGAGCRRQRSGATLHTLTAGTRDLAGKTAPLAARHCSLGPDSRLISGARSNLASDQMHCPACACDCTKLRAPRQRRAKTTLLFVLMICAF
jgi:hypothetical protein